jgi:hypothetical protein
MGDRADPKEPYRQLAKRLDPFRDMRTLTASLDASRAFRELSTGLDASKAIRELSTGLDASKAIRELSTGLDASKAIRELSTGLDASKAIRELSAVLDPFKDYRKATEWLTRSTIRGWTQVATTAAGEPVDELLTDLDTALERTSPDEDAPVSRGLAELPQLAQRRLFLLACTALWAVTDAVDAFGGVTQPAHLDKVIIALLAIATFLSEKIGDPPTDD